VDPRVEQAQRLLIDGRQYEARVLLQTIIEVDPQNVDALFLCVYFTKSSRQAEKLLRYVLSLDPNHQEAGRALDKVIQHRSQQRGQLLASFERRDSLIGIGIVLLALVIFVPFLVISLRQTSQGEEGSSVSAAVSVDVVEPSVTPGEPGPTLQATPLPKTWTPVPTGTQVPTKTLQATITPRPTNTIVATFTPTPVGIIEIEPDVASYAYLHLTYMELSAQASWLQDVEALRKVQDGFLALARSFERSEFDRSQLTAEETEFIDNFVTLLHYSYDLAIAREQVLLLTQTCTNSPESDSCTSQLATAQADADQLKMQWLQQDELVGLKLSAIRQQATTEAALSQLFFKLLTPSATVVYVPSVTPFVPPRGPGD
jgi:hypothetical protein